MINKKMNFNSISSKNIKNKSFNICKIKMNS